jgi:hypothetical protein
MRVFLMVARPGLAPNEQQLCTTDHDQQHLESFPLLLPFVSLLRSLFQPYHPGYIQRHQRGPYAHLNPVPNQTKTG